MVMCEVLVFSSSLDLKKPAKLKRSMTEIRRSFRLASMAISSNYCLDHINGDGASFSSLVYHYASQPQRHFYTLQFLKDYCKKLHRLYHAV